MPRNLSGVYTLPAGNPVVPGTTIDANWANSTLQDISNELTNSLSRTGAGGMLAPFRIDDGNVTGPGLAFLTETNTGYYRVGAGSTAFSVLGVSTLQINTTSVTVPSNRTLNAQGNALVGGTFGVSGVAAFGSTLAVTGAITALGGVLGNVTAAAGTSTFNDVVINGSLDMVAGSSATITGLSNPTNASDAANKGYVDTQDALKLNLSGGTMSGNIAMGNNLVTGLGAPSSGGDATNKTYVDAQVATRLALAGGTMSGAIAMSTNKITGLGTPTADTDAATKAYVDSVAQGLDVKGSVRAATTGNITLSGTQTIDGVAIGAGDRVLVKDQSTAANNGIYVAAAGGWSRAADADTWAELVGAFVFVEDGTINDNSGWVCTSPPGGTLGVTAVTFEQFSGAGQINAGTGMTKSGNTLNVNTASASRIVVNADDIDLATTGVSSGTYRSVTVDAYGRVTSGTNPTTLAGYGITDAYTQTQTDTLLNAKLSLTGGTMSGAIAMGTNKITGLGNPTSAQDAATKTYVDTADALKLSLTGGTMTGAIAMSTNRITGMGDPVNAQDAATKNYIDTIFGSTATAAASAAAAASSATAASTSASNAATSATNAASSASAASTSASNAATSLFNFRAQYLGPLASDPTVDGNGNAVTAGDLYWNTTVNETRIYNGSAWVAAYLPAAGYMDLTTNQTAAGVKTFSSNPILSGGTANGVAYLNGSKVLTTGSALTFDGTRLTSTTGKFGGGAASNSASLMVNNATNTATGIQLFQEGIESWIMGMPANSAGLAWSASGSEQMRLTSTGLGIGTSSPTQKLEALVFDTTTNRTNAVNVAAITATSASNGGAPYNGFGPALVFRSQSYNGTVYNGPRVRMAIGDDSVNTTVGSSLIFDVTATKGASPTEVARFNPSGVFSLQNDQLIYNGKGLALYNSGNTGYWAAYNSSDSLIFSNGTERARLSSTGNLLVGTTTNPSGSGVIADLNGNVRAIPQSGAAKTTSYTLATTDVGEFIQISTGGSITIPTSTFAAGDVVSLFNNTTGNITITCSAPTAYIAGTNTVKTSMTLATRGVATVLFITSTLCVVTGNVT